MPIKIKKTLRLNYRQTFKTTEFILKERKTRYQRRIFSIKKIISPSKGWYQLVWHGMGKELKLMQGHTSDIYRKNFYLPFNVLINIKIGFLLKIMYNHTILTSYKIFYKKHSVHVLSKHMSSPRRHLIAIPSITVFGIKWKKKYMKTDLTSRLKTRENWRSGSKVHGKILPSIYQRFEEKSNSLLED